MFSHAALDASLNGTSAVLLAGGYAAIRKRKGRPSIPCHTLCSRSSVVGLFARSQFHYNHTAAHVSVTIRLPRFLSPPNRGTRCY
jgi:hypothetical protein